MSNRIYIDTGDILDGVNDLRSLLLWVECYADYDADTLERLRDAGNYLENVLDGIERMCHKTENCEADIVSVLENIVTEA